MRKQKEIKPGDIVIFKPIALLLAEKKIRYATKEDFDDNRLLYMPSPSIIKDMLKYFVDHRKLEVCNTFEDGNKISANGWVFKKEWVQKVIKQK